MNTMDKQGIRTAGGTGLNGCGAQNDTADTLAERSEVVTTGSARVWRGECEIIWVFNSPNAVTDIDAAKAILAAGRRVAKSEKPLWLVDIRKVRRLTREARVFIASEVPSTATALVVSSSLSRIIGNFFINLSKTSYPIRLFKSEIEAIEWLKGFLR